MAAKKSEQRLRWEAYLRTKNRIAQRERKFMYLSDSNRPALYGSYIRVASNTPEAIEGAKRELMAQYNNIKSILRSIKIELSPPEFKVKEIDPLACGYYCSYVAWRAVANKPMTIEAKRKMALRQKRMRRTRA